MGIIYTTGTINAANAGAVGLAMIEKIRDDVVAHAAWELVEEYTPASSLGTWYVFKCLATESGLPSDYYVIVNRTIGSGELRAFICEEYNSATHVASFFTLQSGNPVYDADGRGASTYTLGTAVLSNSITTNPKYNVWVPSGVSTKWWITVDDDGFSVAFNGASNGFWHIGAYVPLSALPNPMAVQFIGSHQEGLITRNPGAANLTTKSLAMEIDGGNGTSVAALIPLGFVGRLDINDKLQGGLRSVAEIGIVVNHNSPTVDLSTFGWALGKQKRMRFGEGSTVPAGFAFGDAYVFQSRLWVPYLPTDPRMWDTGVAA